MNSFSLSFSMHSDMKAQRKILFFTGMVVFLLLYGLSSPARGAMVAVRMMQRGPVIYKKILSLRERKFVNIVSQSLDYSCGAAAMATILTYHFGRDASEKTAIEGILKVADAKVVKKKGFSLLDLKRYAETIGYRAGGYRLKAEQLVKIKIPTIVLIDVRGYSHFVVLKGVHGEEVFLADPAWGNRIMSLKDFSRAWNGIIFALEGPRLASANGLKCEKKQALPVDRVLRLRGTMDIGQFIMDPSVKSCILTTIDQGGIP